MASFQSLLETDEVPKAELLPGVEWKEVSSKSRASGLVAVALVLGHEPKALCVPITQYAITTLRCLVLFTTVGFYLGAVWKASN